MKTIYKYHIPVLEKFTMFLPKDAQIIRIDDVEGKFFLWAVVDTDAPLECRHFEAYKTGMPIETPLEDLTHVGRFKLFVMQELCLYVFENTAQKGVTP